MDQQKIGRLIKELRKEKGLTQAQLAERLNITDRAVSKWETGKSMPDSSIMLELCEILGISVNELLSGEKVNTEGYEKKAEENLIALKRKDENNVTKNRIISILFSATLLTGIIVCLICDIAISGNLTWSPIPIGSIFFAWVLFLPGMILGKKGIAGSLIVFSVFVIPYLYLLSSLLKVKEVVTIGAAVTVPSLVFLWLIFFLFYRIRRKSAALGAAFLLAVPFQFIINVILSRMIEEPVVDVWDLLSVFVLLIVSICFFIRAKAK